MEIDLTKFTSSPPKAKALKEAQRIIDAMWQTQVYMKAQIEEQALEIKELKAQLAKNSTNSSKPPSSDGLKKPKPKSRRNKSSRKTGGQNGHKGVTLKQVENPDFTEKHGINVCEQCHCSLEGMDPTRIECRQEFEIPQVKAQVTEHQVEIKICPKCGFENIAKFPEHITQPVQYGNRAKGIMTYFSQSQLLPYERLQEIFRDIYMLQLSEGTLFNANYKCYIKLENCEQGIKSKIIESKIVNFDESGMRVKKELHWLHVAATEKLTYYDICEKRGGDAMDEIGILPEFEGRAIHDHWYPYFNYDCEHGLCNAHHLRELTYHTEQYEQSWCEDFETLLLKIKKTVDDCKTNGKSKLSAGRIKSFEGEYKRILSEGLTEIPKLEEMPKKRGRTKQHPTKNLWDRLYEYREETLAFMYDFNVPFTNNQGERDIRMAKLKQKISGCFRSQHGAKIFCRIRGYISTARKNGHNTLEALTKTFEGNPIISI
jgi:transposase